MTKIDKRPGKPAASEDGGLEDKMRDYHRQGGPQGGGHAKRIEGDIASAAITAADDLEKARPASRPGERE
jgi:hypothetical protein